MFKKIISGGQIGAEPAVLDVAIGLNIPHGGYIQKGRRAPLLTLPEKYQPDEMPTASRFILMLPEKIVHCHHNNKSDHDPKSCQARFPF
ncbi:MAG: hypothetical protein JRC89_11910 [Deltaproteobacteria bacterium]|nr:hypothetical protein [Deltaproteobacteria bacterium]